MSHTFENFVMTHDDFFTQEECNETIRCFDRFQAAGMTVNRQQQGSKTQDKNDDQLYVSSILSEQELDITDMAPFYKFNERFWANSYPLYAEKYGVLSNIATHTIRFLKVQKTVVGGGYHVWHNEDDNVHTMRRIMTFILYLNEIEEGGETEFLYYPKRIKPTTGKLILWPAGYTHAHRGNPPLSGIKYILTGWVEMN
jgi:hypothetical protein